MNRSTPDQDPGKRSASESTAALFARDPVPAHDAPRPAPIIGGTLLVLLRAAATVLWWINFVRVWPTEASGVGVDPASPEGRFALGILLGFGGAWTLLLLIMAWVIWRGSTAGRMIVLVWTSMTIVVSAIGYFVNGEVITVRTTLFTLALDILVLLALSSRDARTWSRSRKHAVRTRRALRSAQRRGE